MLELSTMEIAIVVAGFIAAAVLVAYAKRRQQRNAPAQQGPEYIWLASPERSASPLSLPFAGAETDEATELTYQGAYLLLIEGLRIELMMVEFFIESGALLAFPRPRVVGRVTYTSEAFKPYLREIKSLEDFGRYAPYRSDSLWMMKLTVHPKDADVAVDTLGRAGITVEATGGPQPWWHWQDVLVY